MPIPVLNTEIANAVFDILWHIWSHVTVDYIEYDFECAPAHLSLMNLTNLQG